MNILIPSSFWAFFIPTGIILTFLIALLLIVIFYLPDSELPEREMLFDELNSSEDCNQLLDNYEKLIEFESEFWNDGKSELATKYFNIQSSRLKC